MQFLRLHTNDAEFADTDDFRDRIGPDLAAAIDRAQADRDFDRAPLTLMYLNDHGFSFEQIAAIIEAEPRGLFMG